MGLAKICIVSMENIKRVPYIAQYVECLQDKPFDFVYWDRDCTDDQIGAAKYFPYKHRIHHDRKILTQKYEKLTGYIGFKNFATEILEQGDYERVVCLTGNCAVLVGKILLDKYRGRFIIDIRDYWHEDNKRYHEAEQDLIEASAFPIISSPAYKKFLGDHDFRVMHNSQILTQEQCAIAKHSHNLPLNVVCVGAAKNLLYDQLVIDCFAGDERFHVSFRGRGYDALANYIKEKGINNIDATGEFDFSKTLNQYHDADIVLSMYGNGSPYWDYALSNKLYFAAQLGLPILVCEKTAMAQMVDEYGLGVAFNPKDFAAKDKIARLFEPEVVKKREAGRKLFLERVERDNARTFSDLKKFFEC